ncbi:translation initiation factor IF-3 [Candidatus Peregrinibacteria bacterium]|nr:translation initiation factor IF-3 [Candidatus Peregrinibacteria bacterium]MBI2523971.1 translation initiation factor IF-3 [Candidatus Peregrinibacteria bacterium]
MLLVSADGTTETMSSADALARARAQELDLIEISPKASPPVVKMGDVGHYLYQVQKKEKKQRSHSKQSEVKMLRFGFRTDKHDLERLLLRAREFFQEKHLVKFVVRMRGRELSNKDYASQKLRGAIAGLQDVADIEQEVKLQGNQFIVVLCPRKGGKNALS